MRIIKSVGLLLVFVVAITVGAVAGSNVYAGGGKNYKVTVHNPTQYEVWYAKVFYWEGATDKTIAVAVNISPGGSYTWELGDKCPGYIVGMIKVGDRIAEMRRMDCDGGNYQSYSVPKRECCWDITARVCKFNEHSATSVENYDYGFCKD